MTLPEQLDETIRRSQNIAKTAARVAKEKERNRIATIASRRASKLLTQGDLKGSEALYELVRLLRGQE